MNVDERLAQIKLEGNYRSIPERNSGNQIDFSTNDYLGIGADSGMRRQFMEAERDRMRGMTSSASRLLASRQDEYYELESRLTALYGRAALLFNSGYHANTGMVSALADSKTVILADRLAHASIIDGIVLSRARFSRFRHNDYNHLESLIKRHYDDCENMLIVVEGIYSMDGDKADVGALVELKKRYGKIILYVDEAHSFGVIGPRGLGIVEDYYRRHRDCHSDMVDIVIGTFGKAAGSYGAFCVMSDKTKELAVNSARSFIYSTALPPINCAWTSWVLDRIIEMDDRREALTALGLKLQGVLSAYTEANSSPSHIQPLVVGDAAKTVQLSRRLMDYGIKVLPIRTPTVPPGTERLRFSLSASMALGDLDKLAFGLEKTMLA